MTLSSPNFGLKLNRPNSEPSSFKEAALDLIGHPIVILMMVGTLLVLAGLCMHLVTINRGTREVRENRQILEQRGKWISDFEHELKDLKKTTDEVLENRRLFQQREKQFDRMEKRLNEISGK